MKFSLIVPAYNASPWIGECLASVSSAFAGKEGDVEVIVVDDGSEDDTAEAAETFSASCGFSVKVLGRPHAGQGAARNFGFGEASGDYVWFVDADDLVAAGSARALAAAAEDVPDIIALCAADFRDGEDPVRRFSNAGVGDCPGRAYIASGRKLYVGTPFSVYRRAFLEEHRLRFIEGIYHEDAEFTPRAWYYAEKVRFLDEILYLVRLTPGSTTRSTNPKRAFDSLCVAQKSLGEFRDSLAASGEAVDVLCGFDNLLASDFNHALKNCLVFDKETNRELGRCVFRNRSYLFPPLRRSSFRKFRLEYLVLRLFPRHAVGFYRAARRVSDIKKVGKDCKSAE